MRLGLWISGNVYTKVTAHHFVFSLHPFICSWVKVTHEGQMIQSAFFSLHTCIFEGFSWNLAQMCSSLRWCPEDTNQPFWLKYNATLFKLLKAFLTHLVTLNIVFGSVHKLITCFPVSTVHPAPKLSLRQIIKSHKIVCDLKKVQAYRTFVLLVWYFQMLILTDVLIKKNCFYYCCATTFMRCLNISSEYIITNVL